MIKSPHPRRALLVAAALAFFSWVVLCAGTRAPQALAGMPLGTPGAMPTANPQPVTVGTLPFATPTTLSATSTGQLKRGARAFVQWQGWWTYEPTSSATADGVTVVAAAGGGRWLRDIVTGWPGANTKPQWFVDSAGGADTNDCQAEAPTVGDHGPCLTIEEVINRRLGAQIVDGAVLPYPGLLVTLAGSFPEDHVLHFASVNYGLVTLQGARTYATFDAGTDLTISAMTAWDPPNHVEGLYSVPGLDLGTYANKGFLEVTTLLPGEIMVIGADKGASVDGGSHDTFHSPGPVAEEVDELVAGVHVRPYTVTKLGGIVHLLHGGQFGGGWNLLDLDIGPTPDDAHGVEISGGMNNGAWGCILRGPELWQGTWLYPWASRITASHFYGHVAFAIGNVFDNGAQVRDGGFLELKDHNIFYNDLLAGTRDGPGTIEIDGSAAFLDFTAGGGGAVAIQLGSRMQIDPGAYIWAHNFTASGYFLYALSGSTITYPSGNPPVVVAPAPTNPWKAGGAQSNSLPLVTAAALAGIIVNQ